MSEVRIPSPSVIHADPSTMTRECGICVECCIHLGIPELKKPGGVPCRHLHIVTTGHTKNCAIYDRRPDACSGFYCGWMVGFGHEISGRPDRSGLLVNFFANDDGTPSVNIEITDERRCGIFTDSTSMLSQFVTQILTTFPTIKLMIVNRKTKGVIYFANGEMRSGNLLPATTLTDLSFMLDEKILGRYETRKQSNG